ncbi:hypothetical protein BDR03DRAFT_915602, partial [Suillus americanus]
MSSSGPTVAQTKVVNMVLPLVAISVTSFRLYCRVRQGRLWLDDLWATFAMIFILGLLVVDWLYLESYGEPCFAAYDSYHFLKTPRQIS